MNTSPQDSGIPVLTEVIQVTPRVAPAIEAAPAAATASAPAPEASALALNQELDAEFAPTVPAPINGWLDEEWTRLEQKISERVLTQILNRIDTVLEQRIKDSLAGSVQLAVNELKQGLHETLEEVITDAVAQEIDKIHFSKN